MKERWEEVRWNGNHSLKTLKTTMQYNIQKTNLNLNWILKLCYVVSQVAFPFCILEVKLTTDKPIEWVAELLESGLLQPVPKFSKVWRILNYFLEKLCKFFVFCDSLCTARRCIIRRDWIVCRRGGIFSSQRKLPIGTLVTKTDILFEIKFFFDIDLYIFV